MDRRVVKASKWLALVALVAGCGPKGPPAPADADAARTALIRGLNAWRAGDKPSALNAGAAPVYFTDFEWDRSVKLVDYSLEAADEPYGAERRIYGSFT